MPPRHIETISDDDESDLLIMSPQAGAARSGQGFKPPRDLRDYFERRRTSTAQSDNATAFAKDRTEALCRDVGPPTNTSMSTLPLKLRLCLKGTQGCPIPTAAGSRGWDGSAGEVPFRSPPGCLLGSGLCDVAYAAQPSLTDLIAQTNTLDQLFLFQSRCDVTGRVTDNLTRSRCNLHQAVRGDPYITVARIAAADDVPNPNLGISHDDDHESDNATSRGGARSANGRSIRQTDISRQVAGSYASAVRSIYVTKTGRVVFGKRGSMEVFDLNSLLRTHATVVEQNQTRVLSVAGESENDCHRFQSNQDILFALSTFGHLRPFNINGNAHSNFRNLACLPRGVEAGSQTPHYRPLPTWANLDYYSRCGNFAEFVKRMRTHKQRMQDLLLGSPLDVDEEEDNAHSEDEDTPPVVGALVPHQIADLISNVNYSPRHEGNQNVPFVTRRAPVSLPHSAGPNSRYQVVAMDPTTGTFASSEGNSVKVEAADYALGLSLENKGLLSMHNSLPSYPGAVRAEVIVFASVPHRSPSASDLPLHHMVFLVGTFDGRLLVFQPRYLDGTDSITYSLIAAASAAGALHEGNGTGDAAGLRSLGLQSRTEAAHDGLEHTNTFLGKPLGHFAVTSIACTSCPIVDGSANSKGRILVYTGTASGDVLAWVLEYDEITAPTPGHERFGGNNNGLAADGYISDDADFARDRQLRRRGRPTGHTVRILPPTVQIMKPYGRVRVAEHLPALNSLAGATHVSQLVPIEATTPQPYEMPRWDILWASVAAGGLCRLEFTVSVHGEQRLSLESAEIWQYPERSRGDASIMDFRNGMPFAILHGLCFWPHLSSMCVYVAVPSLRQTVLRSTDDSASQIMFRNGAFRYDGPDGAAIHGGEAERDFRARRAIVVRFLENKKDLSPTTEATAEPAVTIDLVESDEEDYLSMLAKAFGDVSDDDEEAKLIYKAGNAINKKAQPTQHRKGWGPSTFGKPSVTHVKAIPTSASAPVQRTAQSATNNPAQTQKTDAPLIVAHPADSGLLSLPPFCFAPTCCQAIPSEESVLIGFVNGDVSMIRLSDVSMSLNLS